MHYDATRRLHKRLPLGRKRLSQHRKQATLAGKPETLVTIALAKRSPWLLSEAPLWESRSCETRLGLLRCSNRPLLLVPLLPDPFAHKLSHPRW